MLKNARDKNMKTFSISQVGSLIYNFRLEKKKFIQVSME